MITLNCPRVRPVILAGGLGTRLRPRTLHIPKPLLPVCGRPILWYVLENLKKCNLLPPIVSLDYMAELIEAFFHGSPAEFRIQRGRNMAEAFLEIAESDEADGFLGISADVLLPRAGIENILTIFREKRMDSALFVRLPFPGHKKWRFIVENERLVDIRIEDCNSTFERLLLLLRRESIHELRKLLGPCVQQDSLPKSLRPYQSGWTLLLKCLILSKTPVFSQIVDVPVHNINAPDDLIPAEGFVRTYLRDLN